jgi:hypothetical protein
MTNLAPRVAVDLSKPQDFDIRRGNSWTGVIYNIHTADKTEVWSCKVHSKSIEFITANGVLLRTCYYSTWFSAVNYNIEGNSTEFTMSRNKGISNKTKSFTYDDQRLTWKRSSR